MDDVKDASVVDQDYLHPLEVGEDTLNPRFGDEADWRTRTHRVGHPREPLKESDIYNPHLRKWKE